jgi:hypothetical protein
MRASPAEPSAFAGRLHRAAVWVFAVLVFLVVSSGRTPCRARFGTILPKGTDIPDELLFLTPAVQRSFGKVPRACRVRLQ